MVGVGDVLEVVFSGPDPTPVHAVARERCDRLVARWVDEAFGKAERRGDVPRVVWLMVIPAIVVSLPGMVAHLWRRRRPEPGPESELRLWLDTSGRARAERSWESPEGPQRLVSVMTIGHGVGGVGLVWSRGRPVRWPVPTVADVGRLFDRGFLREIVVGLDLERVGDAVVAGRPVTVVRAVRREQGSLWPLWLPVGADSYELTFDREYGTLLAFKALDGDTPYEEVTVTQVVYGQPIDPALLERS